MGDAKKRGPLEVRVQQALERRRKEEEAWTLRNAAYEANLTPEKRARRQNTRLLLASLPLLLGR